jgi:hypothetical protein
MMMPGIKYMNERLGGYDAICEKLGLQKRFQNTVLDENGLKDVSNKVIFSDTREQRPLEFENTVRKVSLRLSDGWFAICGRKSLGDACGTPREDSTGWSARLSGEKGWGPWSSSSRAHSCH